MEAVESTRSTEAVDALDLMNDIQLVNTFLAGIISKMRGLELSKEEALGLSTVMEWQSEKMELAVKKMRSPMVIYKKAA